MVAITVCATTSRMKRAQNLRRVLGNCGIVVDTRREPTLNHAAAWEASVNAARMTGDPWCGVVEDDAIVEPSLIGKLDGYLADMDTDMVSAYLGTGVPQGQQGRIGKIMESFTTGMIVSRVGPLNHVAVFARTRIAAEFPALMRAKPGIACDTLLDIWCQNNRVLTGVPVPSWVDHADGETTVDHIVNVSMPRKAWRYDGGSWSQGERVALYPNTPGAEYRG